MNMSKTKDLKMNVTDLTPVYDLCVGCGICAGTCPKNSLKMIWNEYGMYVPVEKDNSCSHCNLCINVCPFHQDSINEDFFATNDFSAIKKIKYTPETGYYLSTYAGYVSAGDYRINGASGGIASWFLTNLLKQNIVDRIVCVKSNPDKQKLFSFEIFDDPRKISEAAGSCYYPVELSEVIQTILAEKSRYAIIALPCFLKGIKSAMKINQKLEQRIVFLGGLVCNHLKSSAFATYLIRSMGLSEKKVKSISFRKKAQDNPSNKSIASIITDDGKENFASYKWSNDLFKLRSCNYCDDIFAELADITFMDAWLPEYSTDSAGTSIIITRSPLSENIIQNGISNHELYLKPITISSVIQSQHGLINRKRNILSHQLWLSNYFKEFCPVKRVSAVKPDWLTKNFILIHEKIRLTSHQAMKTQQKINNNGLEIYNSLIKEPIHLNKLFKHYAPLVAAYLTFKNIFIKKRR